MPPDLPNDQALNLKKRARRRLVGAVALVLLMVIVLPQILQDRVAISQHESIKITMPDTISTTNPEPMIGHESKIEINEVLALDPEAEAVVENVIESNVTESKVSDTKSVEYKESALKTEKPLPPKNPEVKTTVIKNNETIVASKKPAVNETDSTPPQKYNEHFTVQVGVYADIANVKRIQDQLKPTGFSTHTEKITTPKGENIRLKVGNFTSRQAAVNALDKIKEIGLTGIVVSNE
ncbi:MAG: SPOR domain-containing protein [Methylotenera sp.]|nr:SPOR domain-containing protein [Methylotenera sp.]MDO9233002.1 SPOR domain-containing protein [Methylotenera sp.]MDO9388558.1 SPOR domain-containing protein [Methylotenera sp.]MDP2100906.1 SPOR domain-containing protein [Methylotenera sp.]MDP2281588.1 SPOR domain-containing protein [Methylotenera sp.]